MIIARAPMCINLFGGTTSNYSLSAAINKYVYIIINSTPLVKDISARYSITENVVKVNDLKNQRIKLALLEIGVSGHVEVGSFATCPLNVGFRSHHTYTSALLKGLYGHLNKSLSTHELANKVYNIEKIINDNVSEHSIYTSCLGGINAFSKDVKKNLLIQPLFVDFHELLKLEEHVHVFHIDLNKPAVKFKSIKNLRINNLRDETQFLIDEFTEYLADGNIAGCGYSLYRSWLQEQYVGENRPGGIVEDIYKFAMSVGGFGGKYIGETNNGNLLLVGDDSVFKKVSKKLSDISDLSFSEFKINFVQSGTQTLYKL